MGTSGKNVHSKFVSLPKRKAKKKDKKHKPW
jgi:hypothetical protein